MPAILQCAKFILSQEDISLIWNEVIKQENHPDQDVNVVCVTRRKIKELNNRYRKVNKPTNVLTFSYGDGEHDVILSMEIAENEAGQRSEALRDYTALLLVHAFLHAIGLDHEKSPEEESKMKGAERKILKKTGFIVNNL